MLLPATVLQATASAARPARADTEVLDLARRRAAFDAVSDLPGAHLRELARTLGVDARHAQYNLQRLVAAGLVTAVADGGFVRYYPRAAEGLKRDAHGPAEKRALAALRKPLSLRVILVLLADGPAPLRAVATATAVAPSTVAYHLKRLTHDGVVARLGNDAAERRYAVADPALVEELLVQHPPKRSMLAGFVDVWDALALPPRR